jgi:uncharacterized surface protein with fasciclin (FAS1) repeats
MFDISKPATILVPTNKAWEEIVPPQARQDQQAALLSAALAVLRYHEIPQITLKSAEMKDNMTLGPTNLPAAGNITIHFVAGTSATTHEIRFTSSVAGSYATIVHPDIPVVGSNGIVMHVIDTVLLPAATAVGDPASMAMVVMFKVQRVKALGTSLLDSTP